MGYMTKQDNCYGKPCSHDGTNTQCVFDQPQDDWDSLIQEAARTFSGKNYNKLKELHDDHISKKHLKKIIDGMKVEKGEALFADDPKKLLSEGYTIGYNQALTDLSNSLEL